MLTRAHRQEALSRAYIQAIAGRCGLLTSTRDFDYGIDMTLHQIIEEDSRHFEAGFSLDIQLRSSVQAERNDVSCLHDLDVATYNRLRVNRLVSPRILVLVLLPTDETRWTEQTEEYLMLRHCAYWASLRGRPSTTNTATIRISIPRTNVFSVETLTELMDRIERGDLL